MFEILPESGTKCIWPGKGMKIINGESKFYINKWIYGFDLIFQGLSTQFLAFFEIGGLTTLTIIFINVASNFTKHFVFKNRHKYSKCQSSNVLWKMLPWVKAFIYTGEKVGLKEIMFLLARLIFQPFSSCASNDECCWRYVNYSTNGWNCPNQRGSQDSWSFISSVFVQV